MMAKEVGLGEIEEKEGGDLKVWKIEEDDRERKR